MDTGRVLFIDDELCPGREKPNGSYMWYYTTAMRNAGYDVVEMIGPDEAIAELSAEGRHYDLVILDIMMPSGENFRNEKTYNGLRTGVLLARMIQDKWAGIPIVVLTNVLNRDAISSLKAISGIKAILTKPDYTPFGLLTEIKKI